MTSILSNESGDADAGFGDVLDRAAAHDQAAIHELVAEFEPALLQFAKSRGAADPEAMVNGALSDALTSLPRFRGRDRRAFRAYLYQIIRRRVADQYRKAYSQPKTVSSLDDDLVSELIDHDASAFDEQLADRDLVEEILDQLTEEQREVLEMRVLTGLSIKETATRTGRSEGAVKSMQRRALSSLRSVVIAIAVIALAALAIRALMNAGQGVVVIDNSPANSGAEDGDQSQRPVLEAEIPLVNEDSEIPTGPQPNQNEDGENEDGEAENAAINRQETNRQETNRQETNRQETNRQETDQVETTEAADASQPATTVPSANSSGAGQDDSPVTTTALQNGSAATSGVQAPADTAQPSAPDAEVEPIPAAPCSVITDGSPSVGEVAFVRYHFTGPYELFKGTSVDVIGPQSRSALIPGKASPGKVWNGQRLPFVIGGNMFSDDTFTVKSFLADREVKATCTLSEDESPVAPCKVKTDGEPTRGDTARVIYRTPTPYWTLEGQATYIVGQGGQSAMKSGGDARFDYKVERNFVIDGSMFHGGEFQVRTAFAEGAGHAVCEIS